MICRTQSRDDVKRSWLEGLGRDEDEVDGRLSELASWRRVLTTQIGLVAVEVAIPVDRLISFMLLRGREVYDAPANAAAERWTREFSWP